VDTPVAVAASLSQPFELCKAAIALQLGKEYRQDEALRWGLATVEEESHRLRKSNPSADKTKGIQDEQP